MCSKISLMNLASEFLPRGANILSVDNNNSHLVNFRSKKKSFVIIEYSYRTKYYTMVISNKDNEWEIIDIYDTIGITNPIELEKKSSNLNDINEVNNLKKEKLYDEKSISETENHESIDSNREKYTLTTDDNYNLPENTFRKYRQMSKKYKEIEEGIILDSIEGDINRDNIPDRIYLVGKYKENSTLFVNNIKLVIVYGGINKKDVVNITTREVYKPKIKLKNFQGRGRNDIFISMFSGEDQGSTYYFIYTVENNKLKKIFDYSEYNNNNIFNARFLDDYKVEVDSEKVKLKYLLDVSSKNKEYLNMLYNSDGKLKKYKSASVSKIDNIDTTSLVGNGINQLIIANRVVGINNEDTLAIIITYVTWYEGEFIPILQYMVTYGETL